MSDKREKALLVYDLLCQAMDDREWEYNTDKEDLSVSVQVHGEDVPIRINLIVDEKNQLLKSISPIPFDIVPEKRIECLLAISRINARIPDGVFMMDMESGTVFFSSTCLFGSSEVDKEMLNFAIALNIFMCEKYNDKLLALNKGYIGADDFAD